MRIAYVYDAVYPYIKGGAEKRIHEVGKRLAARGHDVHWFGVKWWDGGDVIQRDGIWLHGVCESKGLYTAEGRRSIGEAMRFAASIHGPLSREDFDVIDAANFPYLPAFTCKFNARMKMTPLVITWHEVWADYWHEYLGTVKGFAGKIIEKMVARMPDRHISVSQGTKRELRALGVGEEKITVVPNGIDFESIQGIPPSEVGCNVLFAGRLISDKNVDVLIMAIERIRRRLPDIKCKIIGDGPERERLVDLANSLGLKRNVEFIDFMGYENFIAQLKSTEVFVLPSTREGFGIVLLEAMASRVPVIAVESGMSAASEIINRENGVLCRLDELEENMMRVLMDEELRAGLAKSGYEYSKGLDWNIIADRVLEVYSETA
jgi:glycosyltransferase involved in cell wall biosynthesis